MTVLFKRKARLVVGDLDVTALRFSFTIEKHLKKEPNTAKITVWNLSQEHRQGLEGRKKGVPVKLEAGYEVPAEFRLIGESGMSLLFLGVLDAATSTKEGSDWLTTIYTDDGKDAVHARVSNAYRAGVSQTTVVKDLAKQMGVGLGNLLEVLTTSGASLDQIGTQFPRGYRTKGSPADTLFRLLDDMDLEGSIQDGELQVTTKGAALPTTAVVLRRDTGLVDVPAVDRKGRLEARCLLIGGIQPGYPVRVESETANGLWRIDSVTYTGDTFGGDWYAEFEGAPLS